MNEIVTVKGLTKRFGKKIALDGIDFEIGAGRIVGLMGPNGAGKTTLIKTLMTIYHADAGEVTIYGEPASQKTKRFISYMPDKNHLFRWMRISDTIAYYWDMFGDFDTARAKELCSFLRLNEKERIKDLSAGTIERVLIMLTFSRNAMLYLLDEPIGRIDPLGRDKILKTILSGVSEESATLISTHLVKDVETIIDDVLFLNEGKLLLADTADHIREARGESIEECYLEVFEHA